MPPPLLSIRNLSKRYSSGPSEFVVFEDLSLDVQTGEQIAIVGESGAGKSTLLHLVSGLDRASSGEICYADRNLTELREPALSDFRNREIGYVWQQHHLLQEFTALENTMMPLLIGGISPPAAAVQALETLAQVHLAERAHHRSGELSGGEQQRVALARALVAKPKLLLADEPTGNLDEKTGEFIFDLLVTLREKLGLTVILVTHNLAFARRCDRILRLEGGILRNFVGGFATELK